MTNYFNEWARLDSKEISVSELQEGDFVRNGGTTHEGTTHEGTTHEGLVAEVLEITPEPDYEIIYVVVKSQHESGSWYRRIEISMGEDDMVTLIFPKARHAREFRQH